MFKSNKLNKRKCCNTRRQRNKQMSLDTIRYQAFIDIIDNDPKFSNVYTAYPDVVEEFKKMIKQFKTFMKTTMSAKLLRMWIYLFIIDLICDI